MKHRLRQGLFAGVMFCVLLVGAGLRATPAYAAGVVGTGTPASCTDAALNTALAGGGTVTFNCGAGPTTITLSAEKTIVTDTVIDGGGNAVLSAHGSRHFVVNPGATLTVSGITLRDGFANGDGGSIFNNGTVVVSNTLMTNNRTDDAHSGGAIVNYGTLTILQSTFEDNAGANGGAVFPRWSASRTFVDHSIFRRNSATSVTDGWGGAFLLWDGAPLVIQDSLLEENSATYGGGIYNFPNSSIVMNRTVVRANRAPYGAGIYNDRATLTIDDSMLTGNTGVRFGGGIDNRGGGVSVSNSVLSDNSVSDVEGMGGAVNNAYALDGNAQALQGTLTMTDSTIAGNHAAQRGGGIRNTGATQLLRVTLDHNSAPSGGGFYNEGTLDLNTSTLSDNSAATGGALYQAGSTLTARDSTVADNSADDGSAIHLDEAQRANTHFKGVIVAGGSCAGDTLQSEGNNLENGNTCGFDQSSDHPNTDPLLQPLGTNGGLTRTRMPDPNSPVVDTGDAGCASPDQRGEARPLGAACDIGAVEALALPPMCGADLAAIADTTVSSDTPDAQQGDSPTLHVANSGGAESRTLLAFDLAALRSAVPPGSYISKAMLEVPVAPTAATDGTQAAATPVSAVLDVRALAQPWAETATWNSQPAPGASYAHGGTLSASLLQIDLSTLAMQWLNGAVTESSVALLPGGPGIDVLLGSREGQQPARLIVQCEPQPAQKQIDLQAHNDQQEQAIARLQTESSITVSVLFANGALQMSTFDVIGAGGVVTDALAVWFLNTHRDLLGTDDAWQLIRRSPDGQHEFFRQVHEGIPVYPAEIALDLNANRVVGAGGNYVPVVALAPTPSLSVAQAEQIAINAIDPAALVLGDTQLRYLNLGLLGHADKTTQLAWRMALRAAPGDYTVFVDAHTGAILFQDLRSKDSYDLDLENGNNEQLKDLCSIFDNDNIGANFDSDARAVSDKIGRTYDFWRGTFGRDSYDDDGEQIEFNIHVNYGGNNASYSPGCDIFGASNGMVSQDILAHEFTHAVVHNEIGVPYQNEQGGLDESLADTFGAFVDTANWTIGESSPAGVLRTMSNPTLNGDPDRYSSAARVASVSSPNRGNDFGGVHTNSGILNKAAFLITDGQIGFNTHNVRGMGRGKAQQLYYNVLVNRLRGNSDFYDMARQMLAEAKALRSAGFFTNADVCTVIEAYAAVELGPADRDCNGVEDSVQDDDADGVPNAYNDPAGTQWDNCRTVRNKNQADLDGDGLGDACDGDSDSDGVSDLLFGAPNDNCRWVYNPSQNDRDKDGEGDACDDDTDGDFVANALDNCPRTYNPTQSDIDHDRVGDVCDLDADSDLMCNVAGPLASGLGLVAGVGCFPGRGSTGGFIFTTGGIHGMLPKPADNCPLHPNTNQTDGDNDGVGDVCDLCPAIQSSDNGDPDHDGRGNACDPDDDNDGVLDFKPDGVTPLDNCREVPNADQSDPDRNGIGFACDGAEQAAWLAVRNKVAHMQFETRKVVRVPIDNCPQCGTSYLPKDLETQVVLQSPVAIAARVVDSTGFVVAKSLTFGNAQTLKFKTPPFAGIGLRTPGLASADAQTADASSVLIPTADDTRYYLEIAAADGVDVSQAYDVQIETTTAIPNTSTSQMFLPFVQR